MIQHALNHWSSRRHYVIWLDFGYGKYTTTTDSLSWYGGAWIKNITPATIRLGSHIKLTVIFTFFYFVFINSISLSLHCLICYQSLPLNFFIQRMADSRWCRLQRLKQVRGCYLKIKQTCTVKREYSVHTICFVCLIHLWSLLGGEKIMFLITHHQQQTGKTQSPTNHHSHGGIMPIQACSLLEFKS